MRYRVMERALQRRADGTWVVRKNPKFVIFDELWGDYCALPRETKPLEFRTPEAAREWLRKCASVWKSWEGTDCADDVPKAWRGFPVPTQSPWAGYMTPVTPYN